MTKTIAIRLTGMVKAEVMRYEEAFHGYVCTGEEIECWLENPKIAGKSGSAMERDGGYFIMSLEI